MQAHKKVSPLIIIVLLLITGAFLLYHWGILQFNHPDAETYPVQGIDVSTYQGTIDWPVLASNDLTFAFIKATEGSSFQDEKFKYNWENAGKTHLKVGAYHFFSYETSGATAVRDTAIEVRRARQQGIMVLGVFTGKERDLPAEKLIYGKDFAYIKDINRFADLVIKYLKQVITN